MNGLEEGADCGGDCTACPPAPAPVSLTISEVFSGGGNSASSSEVCDGQAWVEVLNFGAHAVDMAGMVMSNTARHPMVHDTPSVRLEMHAREGCQDVHLGLEPLRHRGFMTEVVHGRELYVQEATVPLGSCGRMLMAVFSTVNGQSIDYDCLRYTQDDPDDELDLSGRDCEAVVNEFGCGGYFDGYFDGHEYSVLDACPVSCGSCGGEFMYLKHVTATVRDAVLHVDTFDYWDTTCTTIEASNQIRLSADPRDCNIMSGDGALSGGYGLAALETSDHGVFGAVVIQPGQRVVFCNFEHFLFQASRRSGRTMIHHELALWRSAYIGCYWDWTGADLTHVQSLAGSGADAVAECAQACLEYAFMGLSGYDDCSCGNRYGYDGEASVEACDADGDTSSGFADLCGSGRDGCHDNNAIYSVRAYSESIAHVEFVPDLVPANQTWQLGSNGEYEAADPTPAAVHAVGNLECLNGVCYGICTRQLDPISMMFGGSDHGSRDASEWPMLGPCGDAESLRCCANGGVTPTGRAGCICQQSACTHANVSCSSWPPAMCNGTETLTDGGRFSAGLPVGGRDGSSQCHWLLSCTDPLLVPEIVFESLVISPCPSGYTFCHESTGVWPPRSGFCDTDQGCYGDDDHCDAPDRSAPCVLPLPPAAAASRIDLHAGGTATYPIFARVSSWNPQPASLPSMGPRMRPGGRASCDLSTPCAAGSFCNFESQHFGECELCQVSVPIGGCSELPKWGSHSLAAAINCIQMCEVHAGDRIAGGAAGLFVNYSASSDPNSSLSDGRGFSATFSCVHSAPTSAGGAVLADSGSFSWKQRDGGMGRMDQVSKAVAEQQVAVEDLEADCTWTLRCTNTSLAPSVNGIFSFSTGMNLELSLELFDGPTPTAPIVVGGRVDGRSLLLAKFDGSSPPNLAVQATGPAMLIRVLNCQTCADGSAGDDCDNSADEFSASFICAEPGTTPAVSADHHADNATNGGAAGYACVDDSCYAECLPSHMKHMPDWANGPCGDQASAGCCTDASRSAMVPLPGNATNGGAAGYGGGAASHRLVSVCACEFTACTSQDVVCPSQSFVDARWVGNGTAALVDCQTKQRNGACDAECNTAVYDFDGGDCTGATCTAVSEGLDGDCVAPIASGEFCSPTCTANLTSAVASQCVVTLSVKTGFFAQLMDWRVLRLDLDHCSSLVGFDCLEEGCIKDSNDGRCHADPETADQGPFGCAGACPSNSAEVSCAEVIGFVGMHACDVSIQALRRELGFTLSLQDTQVWDGNGRIIRSLCPHQCATEGMVMYQKGMVYARNNDYSRELLLAPGEYVLEVQCNKGWAGSTFQISDDSGALTDIVEPDDLCPRDGTGINPPQHASRTTFTVECRFAHSMCADGHLVKKSSKVSPLSISHVSRSEISETSQ